jgi:hypothetical protein
LRHAFETTRTIEDPRSKAQTLHILARALAEAGAFDPPLHTVRTIDHADDRTKALTSLAQCFAQPARTTEDASPWTADVLCALARALALVNMPRPFHEFAESANLPVDVWREVLHTWRQALLEHATVPLRWLRASFSYQPFCSEVAHDGVRALDLAHLQAGHRDTFDAIIRHCPQLGLDFLLREK